VQRALFQQISEMHIVVCSPEDSTIRVQRQFRQEMAMMKSVGRHPHIVSLIGYCTRAGRLELVVEFCAQGDLLNFLRKVISFEARNFTVSLGNVLDSILPETCRYSSQTHRLLFQNTE
jgi:serine/threonine protein kinase